MVCKFKSICRRPAEDSSVLSSGTFGRISWNVFIMLSQLNKSFSRTKTKEKDKKTGVLKIIKVIIIIKWTWGGVFPKICNLTPTSSPIPHLVPRILVSPSSYALGTMLPPPFLQLGTKEYPPNCLNWHNMGYYGISANLVQVFISS